MPTTSEVRDAYAWQDNYPHEGEINQEASAEFDAWLDGVKVAFVHRFIDWAVYNGAPGAGQAIYNYSGNPWLHEQLDAYLSRPAPQPDKH